ncbi:hypothetical protein R6Q57_026859 [Mikania cordata]
MVNGSSCRDLLLNSQNFCRSIPAGAENPSLSRLCYRRLWGSRNRRALILERASLSLLRLVALVQSNDRQSVQGSKLNDDN